MICSCKGWEEIHGFETPGEYQRFIQWSNDQIKEGAIEATPVKQPYGGSGFPQFKECWFQCRSCGAAWRLVAPEPPFRGVFEPVPKTA
jgi:hypothetical protein